jgi:pyruvate/2-oxoglutarate dehydrogenase complex dihydrolipoamide acyltransferase (E2) component
MSPSPTTAFSSTAVSDVGVAVSVEGGLFTPVVRSAENKSLSQISIEMKELAGRARARQLKPADYQGGTTAVSNLGMFGVEQFNAIISPPHATILAVGAGIEDIRAGQWPARPQNADEGDALLRSSCG